MSSTEWGDSMSLFPDFPIVGVADESQLPSKTYRLDMDSGRIVGTVDGMDAVQQATRKALCTPRMKCLAYDDQYGNELQGLMYMKDITREYIESELPVLLKDALLCDSRIKSVEDVQCSFDGDHMYASMTVRTTFGDTSVEEVI